MKRLALVLSLCLGVVFAGCANVPDDNIIVKELFFKYQKEGWQTVLEHLGAEDCDISSAKDNQGIAYIVKSYEGLDNSAALADIISKRKTLHFANLEDATGSTSLPWTFDKVMKKTCNTKPDCITAVKTVKNNWKIAAQLNSHFNKTDNQKKAVEFLKKNSDFIQNLDGEGYENIQSIIEIASFLTREENYHPDDAEKLEEKIEKWNRDNATSKIDKNSLMPDFPWWKEEVLQECKEVIKGGTIKTTYFSEKLPSEIKTFLKSLKDTNGQNETVFKNNLTKLNKAIEAKSGSPIKFEEVYKTTNNSGFGLTEFLLLLSALTILAIIGGLVWFFKYKKKLPEDDTEDAKKNEISSEKSAKKNDSQDKDNKDEEIRKLDNTVDKLKKEINDKNEEIRQLKEALEVAKSATVPAAVRPKPVPTYVANPITTIYSLNPAGKIFTAANLSQNAQEDHYYILEVSGNKGTFKITENPEMQLSAAQSANSILRNVCDYENQPRDTKTGIKTIANGEIVPDGNNWKVVKNVKIQFV